MRKLLPVLLITLFSFTLHAQDNPLEMEAYFTAIIVSDINRSIQWYENTLEFELANKYESAERGFKQANLKRNTIALELIELDRALNPEDVIPKYDNKTRLLGFFKTGFAVSDFDKWMDHLKEQQTDFYGNVVTDDDGKRMAIITDPDGNRIQIFEK